MSQPDDATCDQARAWMQAHQWKYFAYHQLAAAYAEEFDLLEDHRYRTTPEWVCVLALECYPDC